MAEGLDGQLHCLPNSMCKLPRAADPAEYNDDDGDETAPPMYEELTSAAQGPPPAQGPRGRRTTPKLCKFYNSPKGCRDGVMCLFWHAKDPALDLEPALPSDPKTIDCALCGQKGIPVSCAEIHAQFVCKPLQAKPDVQPLDPPKRKSAPPASTPHVGGTAGAGTQTPYCKFYLSPGGCAHGVTCRFRHDQGITAPQAPTPIPVVPEPVGKRKRPVPCKFYFTAAGCQSGVLCRFSHASGDATDPPAKRGARGNGAAAPVACQRHQKARHPSDINPDTGCCYDHALCDARHLQAEDLPSYDQACPRYDPQASRDKVLCARHGKLRKSMYIDPRTGGCFDSSPCMT
uniref:C3H1-type domain-containing protein n=1 Tax=Eutreptiella gymnastica TaxID=73025 RepID=A0A7S1HZ56_9EUGL